MTELARPRPGADPQMGSLTPPPHPLCDKRVNHPRAALPRRR